MNYLIICIFLSLFLCAFGTDYYISSSEGDDSNNGLSASTPWETLDKVNSILESSSGNTFSFKRGDKWRGQLRVLKSNNNIQAYGQLEDPLPLVKGSLPVTGWDQHNDNKKDNIWVAKQPDCPSDLESGDCGDIKLIFRNNEKLTKAREPNEKYYRIDTATDLKSLTDMTLNQPDNTWTGADVHVRSWSWYWEIRKRYFIDNSYYALDYENEYFYDDEDQKIYLYSKTDPNEDLIEAVYYPTGIYTEWERSNINIDHIELQHYWENGMYINKLTNGIISDNKLSKILTWGIKVHDAYDILIENNELENIYDTPIDYGTTTADHDCGNSYIRGNTITDSALECGIGKISQGIGIKIWGNGMIVEQNRIQNCGSNGIMVGYGNFNTIRENYINNTCLCFNDCGCMYIHTPSLIENNHLINPRGEMEASGMYDSYVMSGDREERQIGRGRIAVEDGENMKWLHKILFGFYLDTAATDIEIKNNYIENCFVAGLNSLDGDSNKIEGNIFYNNGLSMELLLSNGKSSASNTITNNIFFSTSKSQRALRLPSEDKSFGNFQSNKYINPLTYLHIDLEYSDDYSITLYQRYKKSDFDTSGSTNSYHDYIQWYFENQKNIKTWTLDSESQVKLWITDSNEASLSYDDQTMSGGSMKVAITNTPSADNTIWTQPLEKVSLNTDKPYHIQFTAQSEDEFVLELFVIDATTDTYDKAVLYEYAILDQDERTFHFVFDTLLDETVTQAYLQLRTTDYTTPTNFWLKDFKIEQADIHIYDLNDVYPLKCNDQNTQSTIDLNADTYMDVDGNNVGTSLTLEPYTCQLLILKDYTQANTNPRTRDSEPSWHSWKPDTKCSQDNSDDNDDDTVSSAFAIQIIQLNTLILSFIIFLSQFLF
ncbi:secreted protein-related [Anaeramoeba flamelloides]|uniref:Secreted protein-related n=1 Tax=Anaeramoeba flamelloides TaxID=1746091 RepID=A0AAV8A2J5_9EUKA|nr:secreted protein-related [Anaeramoeba flamelloides]